MPSTPEVPTGARDVSVASDECRMNAIKNRKENDWFGHDAGSRTPSSGQRPTSGSGGGARTSGRTSRESEQWFRYDASKGYSPSSSKGGGGKPETESKVFGAQQNWYKHGPEVPDPPSMEKGSRTRSRRSACSEARQQQQKGATDSNDWFRHDHKTASGSRKVTAKVTSPTTALWAQNGAGSPPEQPTTSGPRSRTRLTAPEADQYYRRDKIGSSAEWFSHEHPRHDDVIVASGGSGGMKSARTTRGTPEGGRIADRLKGESEDWFSHDGSHPYVAPIPVVKGNSPMTRELMERAQGREIKQIFRMDENLRTTWTAPPPLFGPPGSPGAASGASTTTPSVETPSSATASSANDVIQDIKVDGLVVDNERNPANSE